MEFFVSETLLLKLRKEQVVDAVNFFDNDMMQQNTGAEPFCSSESCIGDVY